MQLLKKKKKKKKQSTEICKTKMEIKVMYLQWKSKGARYCIGKKCLTTQKKIKKHN